MQYFESISFSVDEEYDIMINNNSLLVRTIAITMAGTTTI